MYRKLLIALAATLALGASACATAYAEETEATNSFKGPTWELNGSPLEENIKVKLSSTSLYLEDKEATGGASRIECNWTGEGTLEPGGSGQITALTPSSCKRITGLCEAETITVKLLHLPWKTQLEEVEGEVRDSFTSSAGNPGWTIECKALGGLFKAVDSCEGSTTTPTETTSEGVKALFDSKSVFAVCTLSKKVTGIIEGTILYKSLSGTLTAGKVVYEFKYKERPGFYTKENEKGTVEVEQTLGPPESIRTLSGSPNFKLTAGCEILYGVGKKCTFNLEFTAKAKVPKVFYSESFKVLYAVGATFSNPIFGED